MGGPLGPGPSRRQDCYCPGTGPWSKNQALLPLDFSPRLLALRARALPSTGLVIVQARAPGRKIKRCFRLIFRPGFWPLGPGPSRRQDLLLSRHGPLVEKSAWGLIFRP